MRKINLIVAAIFFVATIFLCLPRADAFCIQHDEKDICFSVPDGVILTGKLLTDKPMSTITEYLKYFWCEAIYKSKTVMFCVLVDVGHYKSVGAFIQYMGSNAWPYSIYYMWDKLGNIVQLGKMADLEEVIKGYKIRRGKTIRRGVGFDAKIGIISDYRSIKIPFQGRSMEINLPQEICDFSGPEWRKHIIHYSTSLKCLQIFAPESEWRALHNNPYMYFIDILILGDKIIALRRLKIGVASCWKYEDNIPVSIMEEVFEDLREFYSFCDEM